MAGINRYLTFSQTQQMSTADLQVFIKEI